MRVLDATCGGRMMWFNKQHPDTTYADIRQVPPGTIDIRPNFNVSPDVVCDFTALPFPDDLFNLVIFDPPHIVDINDTRGGSFMATKFGRLFGGWETEIAAGFAECWRVLTHGGTLIFKWSEPDAPLDTVLGLLPENMAPLIGHTTGRAGTTKWVTFLKGAA